MVKKLNGSSEKVRRAQILLKANENGLAWTDAQIAEAFGCRRQTVETIRQRLVDAGFQDALDGKKRAEPPTEKLLGGDQEARIIATRLGPPPKGYANGSLRLLARKVVELEIADSVSYETVRRVLKKRKCARACFRSKLPIKARLPLFANSPVWLLISTARWGFAQSSTPATK